MKKKAFICVLVLGLSVLWVIFPNRAEANSARKISANLENHEYRLEVNEASSALIGPVQFLVAGYSDKESIKLCRDGVLETLEGIPANLTVELKTVVLSFEGKGSRGMADSQSIILRCDKPKGERSRVLLHEIGHIVFLNAPESIRNEFRKLFEKSSEGDFVSGYASENELEDFAESFLAFVEFGESFSASQNEILHQKYKFLCEHFFLNRAYKGYRDDFGLTFDLTKL